VPSYFLKACALLLRARAVVARFSFSMAALVQDAQVIVPTHPSFKGGGFSASWKPGDEAHCTASRKLEQ